MARRRPEITLNYSDTQVLLWDTRYVNYDFVHQLNEVFSLSLSCDPEIVYYTEDGREVNCPRYSYYDEMLKLLYVVIDNPVATGSIDPTLDYYDKALFIAGRDSHEVSRRIHHDMVFGVEVDDPYNIRLGKLSAEVAAFRDGGVIQVDYLGFDVPGGADCSLLSSFTGTVPSKVARHVKALSECLQNLFQTLSDTMEMEELD